MPDGARRRSLLWLLIGVAAVVAAAAVWILTVATTAFACFDNNECARDHVRSAHRGRVFDDQGRPASRTS